MKNRLITLAAGLLLLAMLGEFYAVRAAAQLAQQLRATLVQNVDEKGRAPYMHSNFRSCPAGNGVCELVFPAVPSGKRLVVEHVNASVTFLSNGLRLSSLGAPNALFFMPPRPFSDPGTVAVNEPVLAYFESGQSPVYRIAANSLSDVPAVSVTLSGYLVDLAQ